MLDLRSDTVTLPTDDMMLAMASARVGDDGRVGSDGRSEDPAVRMLEDRAAQLLGTEAALFVPTGTFGNMVGALGLSSRDEPFWAHERSHIVHSEKALFDRGLFGRRVHTYRQLEEVPTVLPPGGAVLLVENTLSNEAGIPMGAAQLQQLAAFQAAGWKIHMDGARLFNAMVSTGVTAEDTTASCDTVTFCLSKGLGAPAGSVLCGGEETIARARTLRKHLGGAMRQAGYIAAAGLEALRGANIQRLADDHRNADTLSQALGGIDGLSIRSHTNIILLTLAGPWASDISRLLADRGVLIRMSSDRELRILTHRGVSAEQISTVGGVIAECIETVKSSTRDSKS